MQEWPASFPAESDDAASQAQANAVLQRALHQVQAEFEPQTWSAFWKVVVEERSTADVASELGLSANSVRQAKSRVLRRLRDQLAGWFDA
jgi:RNA polymerase sigma-70 factor (ECF subfamily)